MNRDLHLSPKFADHLRKIGMLEALINALKSFRERENFPFVEEQKRIIKQAVFKGLCDYYGKGAKKPSVEQILKRTEEIADRLYGKMPKTVGEEITEEISKKKEKEGLEDPFGPLEKEENLPTIEQ